MKPRFVSESVAERAKAVERLKTLIDAQMPLLKKMGQGDGRTIAFRKLAEDADFFEEKIRENVEAISKITKQERSY
jgi:hypothetical protein